MSSRKQLPVQTTMDQVSLYTCRFAIGNATGTLLSSTDMKTTISGTANVAGGIDENSGKGTFSLYMGTDNLYPQLLSWGVTVSQRATATGSYDLVPVAHSGVLGQFTVQLQLVSGTAGLGLGATPVTGLSSAEIAKANLTGSLWAFFRNTNRTV